MRESLEKKFEEIGEEAVQQASSVECSIADYVEGLGQIISHVTSALDAAREDLAREGGSDDVNED